MDRFMSILKTTVKAQYEMKRIYDWLDKSVQLLSLIIVKNSFYLYLTTREIRQLRRLIKKLKDITAIRPIDASVLSDASLIISQIKDIRHDLI